MGRTEPSIGRQPAAFRKDVRAKKAKATINKVIPSLLAGNPIAQKGVNSAQLLDFMNYQVFPVAMRKILEEQEGGDQMKLGMIIPPSRNKVEDLPELKLPRVSIREVDTLTAARDLLDIETPVGIKANLRNDKARVTILNMGSPLNPGGGVLNGANSQEESLCMRTTLYPSLKAEWYRLPELSSIYTPDVLVFRDEEGEDLDKKDRFYVNCITAAMIRAPEFELDDNGIATYANQKDRETAQLKMQAVMRIAMRNTRRLVLGAWGCGAHGNPVGEIARIWKSVLMPRHDKSSKVIKERWEYIEEIVFAIKDHNMAQAFADAFGEGLERPDEEEKEEKEEEAEVIDLAEVERQELQDKIKELEQRIQSASNPKVSEGLKTVLEGLKKQLPSEDETSTQDSEWDNIRSDENSSN